MTTIHIDHAEYQKRLKNKTVVELRFIITDAGNAIKANPMGPKAGYYADEQHYANMEIRRRNLGFGI